VTESHRPRRHDPLVAERSGSEVNRRLAGTEMLLRRLHACQDAREAEDLVEHGLPGVADADWAELRLAARISDLDDPELLHHDLVQAAMEAGGVCVAGGEGRPSVIAVPLPRETPGAIVLARLNGEDFHPPEVRLLSLFAEHASSSLRRFAVSAARV
jgi:hypothetical protein